MALLIVAGSVHKTAWDYPFFIGEVDEAYALNSSINVFYNWGDPNHYLYGGVCVLPQSFLFLLHAVGSWELPYFRGAYEKPTDGAPQMRRITPVEPIYSGRRLILALYAFTIICSFWLFFYTGGNYIFAAIFALFLTRTVCCKCFQ